MSYKYNAIALERRLKGPLLKMLLVICFVVNLSQSGCSEHEYSQSEEETIYSDLLFSNRYIYSEEIEEIGGYASSAGNFIPDEYGNVNAKTSKFVGSNLPEDTINFLVGVVCEEMFTICRKDQWPASPYHLLIHGNNPSQKFLENIAPQLSEPVTPGLGFEDGPQLENGSLIKIWGIIVQDNRAIVRLAHGDNKGEIGRTYIIWLKKRTKWFQKSAFQGWTIFKTRLVSIA